MSQPSDSQPRSDTPPLADDNTYSLAGKGAAPTPGTDWIAQPVPPIQRAPTTEEIAAVKRRAKQSRWVLVGCNLLVFVSSVCVMVLELTASRLIAKHVGQSLYTWTSVIGVVLAGITIGNFLGGWLADRSSPGKLLHWLFLTASILCLSVLWLDGLITGQARPDGWSWPAWVLTVVGMIFFLPSLALGTISPVVASLALSHSKRVGLTVGNVYAWGAFGSIIGTFLAGFVLFDVLGTRAIVALTAGTLAALGVAAAGGEWAFRAGVLFGWLQLVTWIGLTAGMTSDGMRNAIGAVISVATIFRDADSQAESIGHWQAFGAKCGTHLHELGLTLGLRDDAIGEYHDESNYSYINVDVRNEEGEQMAILKLDKLIHSYWVPDRPTALHYDYEQIYAAVTEQAVASWDRVTTVTLEPIARPADVSKSSDAVDEAAARALQGPVEKPLAFPSWVRFDEATRELSLRGGLTPNQRDDLLRLHPYWGYWQAVVKLAELTRKPDWGHFGTVPLLRLPDDVNFPKELTHKILFDRALQRLNVYATLTDEDVNSLQRLGNSEAAAHFEAVDRLYRESRRIRTMFLGGGGFVFPRWIEALFPQEPLIHVAELDPGVKAAVHARMGLPPDDETRVQTALGDARNFVDDRVRANVLAKARGETPLLYDFVYGDAFNDFSVPWHLTTLEFTRKVAALLDPREGVYLVNLIDVYPRTEFPFDTQRPDGSYCVVEDVVPDQLTQQVDIPGEWASAPLPYEGLEVQAVDDGSGFRLAVRGVMSDQLRKNLLKLGQGQAGFLKAIQTLDTESQKQRTGQFLGSYVKTTALVFPFVYVFSSEKGIPSSRRDTFVIVASHRELDLTDMKQMSDHWSSGPFASLETNTAGQRIPHGQMMEVLAAARGIVLTDNYAPVDNLLSTVFDER